MTCIIYVDGVLVADRAGVTDDFVFERTKIHHRPKMIWGSAGNVANREMLEASCLHDLMTAYQRHAKYLQEQRHTAMIVDHDGCAWQAFIEDGHPYIQGVESGVAIGAYRNEWMNYSTRHGSTVKSAVAFCRLVSTLYGLKPVANALPASALRPNGTWPQELESLKP